MTRREAMKELKRRWGKNARYSEGCAPPSLERRAALQAKFDAFQKKYAAVRDEYKKYSSFQS